MARRGEGFDISSVVTNYVFLLTTILAAAGTFVAFIGQAVATAKYGNAVTGGTVWFVIFVQILLIAGVVYTLGTGEVGMHRFQISVFGAICIVFAVQAVHAGIYAPLRSLNAMAAGWLIVAMVDIIWVLYFTSEDGSLILHVFDSFGGGAPMNRRMNRRRAPSGADYNAGAYGDVGTGYRGGGISNTDVGTSFGVGMGGPAASQHSLGPKSPGPLSTVLGGQGMSQVQGTPSVAPAPLQPQHTGASGATSAAPTGIGGMQGGGSVVDGGSIAPSEQLPVRAKALYAYQASPDDPNEITFSKGEIMEIVDKQGKWWQAKKADGSMGIAPSNYLQII